MKKYPFALALTAGLVLAGCLTGCSGAFWGGTATGAAGTGTVYELRSRQQMQKIEEQYKNGQIDQKEYEIRKDQIKQGSLAY